jgi:hypothetical protein
MSASRTMYRFDVALSFSGLRRDLIREVAEILATRLGRDRVLFDEFHRADLCRLNLDAHLPDLYLRSELLVVFQCSDWIRNSWCGLEWRFIRSLIFEGDAQRIMPVRLEDPGDLTGSGILPTDGYLDAAALNPASIAEHVLERLAIDRQRRGEARVDSITAPARAWVELLRLHGCPFDPQRPTSVVALTAACLRIAAVNPVATRTAYLSSDPTANKALRELERKARTALRSVTSSGGVEFLHRSLIEVIHETLEVCRRAVPTLHDGVMALKVAQVLDAELGHVFIDRFRDTVTVLPGSPVPVSPFPFDGLSKADQVHAVAALAGRGGKPSSRATWISRVQHLCLAPGEAGSLRVRLVWCDSLEPVRDSTRFAAVIPNPRIDDFRWDEYQIGERAWFYAVEAKDLDLQRRLIEHGLRTARARGATVVVLPELSCSPELVESLADAGAFAELPLVVAGSAHARVAPGTAGHNIARVFARGKKVHEHRKFSDFFFTREDGTTCHEHLARSEDDGFDILIAPGCSLVVLICKDAMDPDIVNLLATISTSMLLVPAMSAEVGDFVHTAETLARRAQSFSLVACAGTPQGAIFGRPSRDQPPRPGGMEAPCVVIFSLDGASETFVIEE